MQGTVTVHEAARPRPVADGGSTGGAATGQSQLKPKGCISQRNFKIRIREPHGSSLPVGIRDPSTGGRSRCSEKDGRFTAQVDLRGFSTGTYEVRIKARTEGGRTLTGVRRYRTCAPKLASSALPRL